MARQRDTRATQVSESTHVNLDELLAIDGLAWVSIQRHKRVLLAACNKDTRVSVRLNHNLCAAPHAVETKKGQGGTQH